MNTDTMSLALDVAEGRDPFYQEHEPLAVLETMFRVKCATKTATISAGLRTSGNKPSQLECLLVQRRRDHKMHCRNVAASLEAMNTAYEVAKDLPTKTNMEALTHACRNYVVAIEQRDEAHNKCRALAQQIGRSI